MLNAKNAENTQSRHLTCFTFFSMNSIVTMSESVYQVETHFHKREIPGFHDFPPYLDVGMNDVVVTLIYLILKKIQGGGRVEAEVVQPPLVLMEGLSPRHSCGRSEK